MKLVRLALAITVSLVLLCCLCPAVQASDNKTGVDLKVTVVPPPPGGGGGGGGGVPFPGLTLLRGCINSQGVITCEDVIALSPCGCCKMVVKMGAKALNKWGHPLSGIIVLAVDDPPPMPEDYVLVAACEFRPEGATFDPSATLIISYDTDDIPDGYKEENLVMAMWDEEAEEWIILDSVVDLLANTITIKVRHLSIFAILAGAVAAPADFSVSELSIAPEEVSIGENINISVRVTNTGNSSGSYTATFKINGAVEATKEVTLDAGASQKVTFTTAKDVAASYSVDVNGLSGSFTVKEEVAPAPPPAPTPTPPTPAKPINWPLVGGIIAAGVAVGLGGVFYWIRRRV
ncbi:hypothetical protein ES707_01946 [subsurface metagenome]